MASQTLAERSAFADLETIALQDVAISWRDDLALASFCAAKGKREALVAAIQDKYGIALPSTPMRVEGKDIALMWSGPDQWMAVAERAGGRDLERELKPLLAGLAAVVDQTDARAIARISGPRSREV